MNFFHVYLLLIILGCISWSQFKIAASAFQALGAGSDWQDCGW